MFGGIIVSQPYRGRMERINGSDVDDSAALPLFDHLI